MITAQAGKDKFLMFRKLGDKTKAAKLALQTEHKWEYERKGESISWGYELTFYISLGGINIDYSTSRKRQIFDVS